MGLDLGDIGGFLAQPDLLQYGLKAWEKGGKNAADASATVSPETESSVQNIQNLAQKYRSNVPAFENAAGTQMTEDASNQALASDQALKGQANNRGLLFSGILPSAQNQARGNMASALMNKRAKINQQIEGNAYGMEQEAASAGMSLADLQRQIANQKYNAQYKTSQQDKGYLGGFMAGFGGG